VRAEEALKKSTDIKHATPDQLFLNQKTFIKKEFRFFDSGIELNQF
jgi:transcription-repair coupling factor (superfamily II helicase)